MQNQYRLADISQSIHYTDTEVGKGYKASLPRFIGMLQPTLIKEGESW